LHYKGNRRKTKQNLDLFTIKSTRIAGRKFLPKTVLLADAQNLEFSENLEQLNEAPKDLFK
jgi:hypothetical protein